MKLDQRAKGKHLPELGGRGVIESERGRLARIVAAKMAALPVKSTTTCHVERVVTMKR